jgi:hypothetical protein
MRVYKIALHVSALRPSLEAEQVLQDLQNVTAGPVTPVQPLKLA